MAAAGTFDTSTLAAHDFDVDTRTGFMPPEPPLTRLPAEWEAWEAVLDEARASKLQVADKVGLTEDDEARAARWQTSVREVSPADRFFRLPYLIMLPWASFQFSRRQA